MSNQTAKPQLIENVYLLESSDSRSPVISNRPVAILVESNQIEAIIEKKDDISALRGREISVIDGGGKIAMPGLINGHCHTYATVLRGSENSQPLEVWALYTMAYGRHLDPGLIHSAVAMSAVEMIRGGVTSVIDHIPHIGLLEHTMAAHEKYGMRVGVAPFMQDIPDHKFLRIDLPAEHRIALETPSPKSVEQTRVFFEEFFAQLNGMPNRMIGMIGPNAPQRCSVGLWKIWRELQEKYNAPVHTHLLETKAQAVRSHQVWEGGLVAEMARHHLLNDKLSVAHGIWLHDNERDLLARHGVTVIHNPASNLMLGSGAMPFIDYRQRGVPIGIGSDSANTAGRHDIFEGAKLAAMLPRLSEPNFEKWPAANEVLFDSIEAGAKALGLDRELGQLSSGKLADLILIDREDLSFSGLQNNAEVIAQHAGRGNITDVMIDGEWVMRDRNMTMIDEDELQTSYLNQREAYLERMQEDLEQAHMMAPHVSCALSKID